MKARFEVSTEGMKGLHDGRPLWSLVKELVANAWDEDTTLCKVTIDGEEEVFEGGEIKSIIKVSVEDDGEGFKDIADAFTLMAPTAKRQEAGVRGRFNIGEKEILSVALEGKVETVGTTIDFPREGGRVVTKNKRKKGTIVSAIVQRPLSEIEETEKALLGFLPPSHITYTVNDEVVEPRKKIGVAEGTLHTVLATGIGQPLRYSYRKTTLDVFEPQNDEGHIYEMGITIQPIEMPYDVDIQQKVPMPPNRDTVTARYLQDIYSHVLSIVADKLDESEASESWVQMAVEDDETSDQVVEKIMKLKLGENSVLWSNDVHANETAHDMGMELIKPKTLSKIERERFKKVGLTSSKETYGHKTGGDDLVILKPSQVTQGMKNVENYARWLSQQLLGFECNVRFIKMGQKTKAKTLAQYGNTTLDFVVDALGKKWFENNAIEAPRPMEQWTSIMIHELAHEGGIDHMPHTGEYVHRLADLGAKATHLAINGIHWDGMERGDLSQCDRP